jgi:VWFA-related protein
VTTPSRFFSVGLLRASLFIFIGAALLVAKQIPENTPQLVNLNVTAVDSHGQQVTDLRAEDLQIVDNGKPRPTVWLRALSRKAPLPRATFILLDLYNADLAARGLGDNEVAHTLEGLGSGDNVYLYLLTSAATIYPVRGVAAPHDDQWTRRVKPMLDDALRQVNRLKSGNDLYADLRIGPTWQALSNFASQLAEVPGPKSFLWITQGVENGFFQPGRQFVHRTAPLRDYAALLSALETAIYTVQQRPSGSLEVDNEGSPGDTLKQLSALTGGRSYLTDSTEEAIAQAISDVQRMNYRMAFSPDRLDGKYHKIHVTSLRTDIKIQAPRSYYASAPDVDQSNAGMISAISRSPFDYPEIGVAATLANVEGAPGQSGFAINVNASDVVFLKEGARYKAHLAVELIEYGSSGQSPVAEGVPVNLDMSEEEHAKAMTEGIRIAREAALDGTIRQVRLAVLDVTSNLAGTVTMPIGHKP